MWLETLRGDTGCATHQLEAVTAGVPGGRGSDGEAESRGGMSRVGQSVIATPFLLVDLQDPGYVFLQLQLNPRLS